MDNTLKLYYWINNENEAQINSLKEYVDGFIFYAGWDRHDDLYNWTRGKDRILRVSVYDPNYFSKDDNVAKRKSEEKLLKYKYDEVYLDEPLFTWDGSNINRCVTKKHKKIIGSKENFFDLIKELDKICVETQGKNLRLGDYWRLFTQKDFIDRHFPFHCWSWTAYERWWNFFNIWFPFLCKNQIPNIEKLRKQRKVKHIWLHLEDDYDYKKLVKYAKKHSLDIWVYIPGGLPYWKKKSLIKLLGV